MSLRIYLLGQFALRAGNRPLELTSRPAQSLLAYLALYAGVTQRREKLAGLLWPEATASNARSYLRQALWRMRKALGSASLAWEAYLQINDIEVVFNRRSDYWLDAEQLLKTSPSAQPDELIETVRLYRGELLPGFYDEWIEGERDRLHAAYQQKMNMLLAGLVAQRRWQEVLTWGEQWIRLGHSPEPAYRALMSAYGGLGDQGMVSATYQRCVEALRRDLDVSPSQETEQHYSRLRRGQAEAPAAVPMPTPDRRARRPSFLAETVPPAPDTQVFVARERELDHLRDALHLTLAGTGRVAFIAGEAGAGKTALVHEFARRTQAVHTDLIVAVGNCNAHTGRGDPYLPFREILGLLAGDVEAQWAAGAITREHAIRLWHTLPLAGQALVRVGPGLVDSFVAGLPLVERALAYGAGAASWVANLKELAGRNSGDALAYALEQTALFQQYTGVLQFLARHAPLVLVIDDLQWADRGSIELLFHLCRHIAGSRILVLGTYRLEEVAMRREGARHLLLPVVNEAQRLFGDILVNLDQAAGPDFVEAILDSEPNCLGPAFRQMLYRQTRGHPLFTVELLRGMQERGDLLRDVDGRWAEASIRDWETLPARVEAVIAERVGRLSDPLQATLRVASVEGETFTAEVIARVRATDRHETVEQLSGELDRRHRLVRAQSIVRSGDQLLSRYRFRHILFQKYLYSTLDEVERVLLHEQVGTALEELATAAEALPAMALELARHFEAARLTEKAIHFLHLAGQRAVQLSAYDEAIAHLTRGLALLATLPATRKRAQLELPLQLTLGMAWMGPRGYGPEVMRAHTRAGELCRQLADKPQLCRVQGELAVYCFVRAEYFRGRELAQETLTLAEETGDPLLIAIAHWHLGFISFYLGEYVTARAHFAETLSFYNPQQHHSDLVRLRGSDSGSSAMAFDACCLWALGFPDQAVRRSQEALALAREFGHPFSLADVICFGGCVLSAMRGDVVTLKESARELMQISNTRKFAGWIDAGNAFYGEALARSGNLTEGIAQIENGFAGSRASNVLCQQLSTLRALATAQAQAGEPAEALRTLQKALALVEQTGERHWEPELHRLRGELLLMEGNVAAAERSLRESLAIARHQQAKSWELRAANDLARLWQQQGKTEEARQLLQPIYDWFGEGFDTPDLQEARHLLAGD